MYFDNCGDGGDVSKIERESLKVRQLLFSCLIILYCIHCYKLIFAVPIVPFIKLILWFTFVFAHCSTLVTADIRPVVSINILRDIFVLLFGFLRRLH